MDLIILNDGMYSLVSVTKEMLKHIKIYSDVNCFSLCDIIRLEFSTYHDAPINRHVMNNGSGDFIGCICR